MMTWPQKKEEKECKTYDERVRNPSIYSSLNLIQQLSADPNGETIYRISFLGV